MTLILVVGFLPSPFNATTRLRIADCGLPIADQRYSYTINYMEKKRTNPQRL